jgi:predicted P-loop ATPase
MAMEKQKRLVDLLLERTNEGKLEWREAVQPDSYQVALRDKLVRIMKERGRNEDEPDYIIELVDDEGKVVDAFTDVQLWTSNAEDNKIPWFARMRDLHDLARRTALGSEKVLNDILNELGDDEIPF